MGEIQEQSMQLGSRKQRSRVKPKVCNVIETNGRMGLQTKGGDFPCQIQLITDIYYLNVEWNFTM